MKITKQMENIYINEFKKKNCEDSSRVSESSTVYTTVLVALIYLHYFLRALLTSNSAIVLKI